MHNPELAPLEEPEFLAAVQYLWREELGEHLTWQRARRYGPRLVAIVLAAARAKRGRQTPPRAGKRRRA